jgi:nucleoside-diphosphate-sugar epimerase
MLSQETIFLTGFPGFIAARLIKELAKGGAQFLLLVQPAFAARARTEITRLSEETGMSADRFRIVEGDITRARLGMSEAEYETARRETTLLFHLAAIYDLAVRREPAMQVNLEGTRQVNSLRPHVSASQLLSLCFNLLCRRFAHRIDP